MTCASRSRTVGDERRPGRAEDMLHADSHMRGTAQLHRTRKAADDARGHHGRSAAAVLASGISRRTVKILSISHGKFSAAGRSPPEPKPMAIPGASNPTPRRLSADLLKIIFVLSGEGFS